MLENPKIVFCFSGKRKSGKDFVTEILQKRHENSVILRLSAPIKEHWAREKGLDLNLLMSDSPYKELHRQEMVHWGEEKRAENPGFFCEAAIEMFRAQEKPIWIVSDCRRKSDIQFFKSKFGSCVKTVRVEASADVRERRGFIFTPGIDDAETECGLDDYSLWDFVVDNSDGPLDSILEQLAKAALDN